MNSSLPLPPPRRVIVLTGATAGIGRAAARAFAREGACITLVARGLERLQATQSEVESLGGSALIVQADVADPDAIEHAAALCEATFGPIDVWVNNAMASVFSPIKEMTAADFKRVTEVTYLGYVHGTLAALKRMLPRDRGVIIQVGSALAYRGIPLQSAYCAAKHAVNGFMDSLRSELLHDGSHVHVTMLQMPAVNTPQFGWVKSRLRHKAQPVPPIYQPEVAADAILYASHHPRREFYIGWPSIKAILGNKLAPAFADRFLARHGYDSQQTTELEDPRRPDNLHAPAPGTQAAHGVFDATSQSWSPAWWLSKNRDLLLKFTLAALAWCVISRLKPPDPPAA